MKSKLIMLLLVFSFCSFAGVDSGTGGEPENAQNAASCEMYLQGVDSGTGGTDATDDGSGGKPDQAYLEQLYSQCMEESKS